MWHFSGSSLIAMYLFRGFQYAKGPGEIAKCNKVSKGAKIRNRYNKVPHLTQDTNGKVTNSQLDTTNEIQEVSPFPAGYHKAHINRRAQRHSKHKTESIKDAQRSTALERSVRYFTGRHKPVSRLDSNVEQDTFGKVTKHNTHDSQEISPFPTSDHKATKNRHNITTHTIMNHN